MLPGLDIRCLWEEGGLLQLYIIFSDCEVPFAQHMNTKSTTPHVYKSHILQLYILIKVPFSKHMDIESTCLWVPHPCRTKDGPPNIHKYFSLSNTLIPNTWILESTCYTWLRAMHCLLQLLHSLTASASCPFFLSFCCFSRLQLQNSFNFKW